MTTAFPPSGAIPTSSGMPSGSLAQNYLMQLLPTRDRQQLQALCKPVQLALGDVLCEAGAPTRHVYFPIDGFISLIATSPAARPAVNALQAHTPLPGQPTSAGVEVGMVGREGMLGTELVLGAVTAPLQALVQGQGLALRVEQAAFKRQLALSEPLRRHLLRYVYVLMAQQATAASCLRFHQIGPRLARWLLMSQDRAHANHFHLTQEFLAYMLGVRRVGITFAASALQRSGLIAYRRGELHVLDRAGLELAACSCYSADQSTYRAML